MAEAAAKRNFVGGNWKCNKTLGELKDLAKGIQGGMDGMNVDVIVSPSPCYLSEIAGVCGDSSLMCSSQNVSATGFGAYTGEIAPDQLKDLNIGWTIIGHSERRKYYGESNDVVTTKVTNALSNGLKVIACFGETKLQRDDKTTDQINQIQLAAIIKGVPEGKWGDVVLAYEPVWAIGTGDVCGEDEAERVCGMLRSFVAANVSDDVAKAVRIIYGGSVKPKNCEGLIAKPNIDGFLVGGASLKVDSFTTIIKSASKQMLRSKL